jgi:membrane-associated phospholipid phosphatase
VRRAEWIAAGYFLYLLLPVWLRAPKAARTGLTLEALIAAALVVVVSRVPETWLGAIVRDWAPGVYLLAGYWLPGRLFTTFNERLERWLMARDREWLGESLASSPPPSASALFAYLELTYMLCYPLVPVAFGLLYFSSSVAATALDRFWSAVLTAVFICYGLLPWLPTRPPRAFLPPDTRSGSALRKLNLHVLNHASIQVNTLPSGHVAAAVAAALAVGTFMPAAGAVIGVLAVSIALAAVLGRYHYAADAVLGALTALAAFAITESRN